MFRFYLPHPVSETLLSDGVMNYIFMYLQPISLVSPLEQLSMCIIESCMLITYEKKKICTSCKYAYICMNVEETRKKKIIGDFWGSYKNTNKNNKNNKSKKKPKLP